jgi:RsiW-degrading membrane proteinase PrsW (M82 family)
MSLLWDEHGEPKLVWPSLIVLCVVLFGGLGISYVVRRPATPAERAASLAQNGRFDAAEQAYKAILEKDPTPEAAVAFVKNHLHGVAENVLAQDRTKSRMSGAHVEKMMDEDDVDALLGSLSNPDALLAARFERGLLGLGVPEETRGAVMIAADREPPAPLANQLLAEYARKTGDLEEAANRYEREGLAYPERASDVDLALQLWMTLGEWDRVRTKLADPRVRKTASGDLAYALAMHDHDWLGVARAALVGWRSHTEPWELVTAGAAALAWAFFCARLGKLRERVALRLPLYVVAFALGVLSVVPTLVLVAVEQEKLRLVETGDATRDILFFIFGVGLREEGSKILLFLPLLPFIRKWGTKLDVLVCGAMVGLGFAAEENLGYLASGNLHTGLARFLTANFFHMAMTGTIALALDELFDDREENAMAFTRTALSVVAIHGAYDFLLSHEEFGGSYMSMLVFIFLTRLFLAAVDRARGRADKGMSLAHAFLFAMAVVTGITGVRAVTAVGAWQGALVMAEGLLGVGIILIVFVRTLRTM